MQHILYILLFVVSLIRNIHCHLIVFVRLILHTTSIYTWNNFRSYKLYKEDINNNKNIGQNIIIPILIIIIMFIFII